MRAGVRPLPVVLILAVLAACGGPASPRSGPPAGPPSATPTTPATAAPSSTSSAAGGEAPADAARRIALVFFTVDYRKIDTYIPDVEGVTSASLHNDFVAKAGDLRTTVGQVRSVARPSIRSVAARAGTSSSDDVILALDQQVTTRSTSSPTVNRYRIAMHLVRVGPSWLADQLDPVQSVQTSPCTDADAPPADQPVLDQACSDLVDLLSLDTGKLATTRSRVGNVTTGPFRGEALQTLNDAQVRDSRATVRPMVLDAAIVRSDADTAQVLAFVDETVVKPSGEPTIDHGRTLVDLRNVGGRWLISGVTAL
jgi:hypothetical protein